MLRRLGGVQLDTISVLARSHELVAYARLGAIGRAKVEQAYWHPRRPAAFEYWSHAACVLPIEEWPYYAFRRRAFRERGLRWHQSHPDVCERVLARIRSEGPLTATELGGAKNGGPWWDWSDTKIAVEWLLDTGDVICVRRTGWKRVYDLPERVLPPELLGTELTDSECVVRLAAVAGRALGVVTQSDLADYQRLRYGGAGLRKDGQVLTAADAAQAAGLVPVEIAAGRDGGSGRDEQGGRVVRVDRDVHAGRSGRAGRDGHAARDVRAGRDGRTVRAWLDPTLPDAQARRGRHRTTLLSPFDSLVWDRKRTLRTFRFEHSLEAYVPQGKRVHGYYTMPLLAGGRLVGRVDPARSGNTLIARKLTMDKAAAVEPMAQALVEAASWVGCDNVKLQQVEPQGLEQRLQAALTEFGA